jgi:glyoxylase-like metal-dependent hydrolase (beta-lactamase superfamily II)
VLVVGDTVIEREGALRVPEDWLSDGTSREDVAELLRPLLDLPIELVLPTHGSPTGRAELERALA